MSDRGAVSYKFQDALTMTSVLHRGQVRKGTSGEPIPYLAHVLEVSAIVLAESVPEEVAIAALLHDGPEDCGGLPVLDLIRRAFGDRVADLVAGCSDTYDSPKPPWMARKRLQLEHLKKSDDWDLLLVKCADCLSNARATLADHRQIGSEVWHRFNMSCASNQRWWYASVRDAVSPLGRYTRGFAALDATIKTLLEETQPCPGCEHQHLDMPSYPELFLDEEWLGGGYDPAHRCPACGRVPIAPGDGSGRICESCGTSWPIR